MSDTEQTFQESLAEALRTATGGYVIYSWDMTHASAGYGGHASDWKPRTAADKWVETEDDDQWEYGYLERERSDIRVKDVEYLLDRVDSLMANDYPHSVFGETLRARILAEFPLLRGYHRKWCAELTGDELRAFISDDLGLGDDWDEVAESAEQTMGSITEYGWIPAVSFRVDDGYVFDCSAYVSILHEEES